MELRTRARATSYPRLRNACAQCGEVMFMPEWSEYQSEQRVRHLWTCNSCGYRFETIVFFPPSHTRLPQPVTGND
jgi:ribosomal protein S27AE